MLLQDASIWEFKEIVIALVLGFIFGFALDKGGMTRHHKIVNVFRFTDLAVLKFMMSAMVTGMIGIYGLKWIGAADLIPSVPLIPIKHITGGLLFGVGMALVGLCPGTVVGGAGRGQLDYLIPGIAGMFSGALAYGFLYPRLNDFFTSYHSYGTVHLPELWNLSSGLAVFTFAEAMILLLYVLAKTGFHRKDHVTEQA